MIEQLEIALSSHVSDFWGHSTLYINFIIRVPEHPSYSSNYLLSNKSFLKSVYHLYVDVLHICEHICMDVCVYVCTCT